MPPPVTVGARDRTDEVGGDARRRGGSRSRGRAAREEDDARRAGGERRKGGRHAGSDERGARAKSKKDKKRSNREDGGKRRRREHRHRSSEWPPPEPRRASQTRPLPTPAGPPATASSEKEALAKKKEASCAVRWLRIVAFILFALAYGALCVFMLGVLSRAKAREVTGRTDGECAGVDCGHAMVCIVLEDSNRARCTDSGSQNVHVLEVIVGIILGFPAAILVPWSLHGLWRLTLRYVGPKRRRTAASLVGSVPLPPSTFGRLSSRWGGPRHTRMRGEVDIESDAGSTMRAADPLRDSVPVKQSKFAAGKGAAAAPAAVAAAAAAAGDADDDLDDFFAPVKKEPAAGEKPGGPGLFQGDDGGPEDEDSNMDDWFANTQAALAASQSRAGGSRGGPEGSFVAPRQGPGAAANQAGAPPLGAGVGSLSGVDPSNMGLSCLFAATKGAAADAIASKAASSGRRGGSESKRSAPPPSDSGSGSGEEEEEEEEDDDDAEPAVTIDFHAFAMRVSRYGEAVSADTGDVPAADRGSPLYAESEASVDSMLENAEATMDDLFHAPLPPAPA